MTPRRSLQDSAVELTARVSFRCYHCRAECRAEHDPDPVLVHPLPQCSVFERIKTLDDGARFLQDCRLKGSVGS